MRNYTHSIYRSKTYENPCGYWLSSQFQKFWKRSRVSQMIKPLCIKGCSDFLRFQFPTFPLETQRLETQIKTLEPLVLLLKKIFVTFPISKTHFQLQPLLHGRFQFPEVIYKYIYEGLHLHTYLSFKTGLIFFQTRRSA